VAAGHGSTSGKEATRCSTTTLTVTTQPLHNHKKRLKPLTTRQSPQQDGQDETVGRTAKEADERLGEARCWGQDTRGPGIEFCEGVGRQIARGMGGGQKKHVAYGSLSLAGPISDRVVKPVALHAVRCCGVAGRREKGRFDR